MVVPVLGLILVGLAISLPVTALLVRLGHRLGAMDTPGAEGHRKVLRAVPNIGGIAIVLAVAAPLAAGLAAVYVLDAATLRRLAPALSDDLLDRIRESTPAALAMLGGMIVLHVVGLVDDRRSLAPGLKLAAQFATALVMAWFFDVRLLTLLETSYGLGPWPSIIITVLWIVVVTNAINFMDNMDGLAGGVSAIAACLFMAACLVNRQWFIAATLALLVGAIIGFLVFNFPPAKVFMGDGGSLVIGFILAILTARTTYYSPDEPAPGYALGSGWYGVFMPIVVLAVPLYDFVTVTVLRLAQGRSPLVGDQQHFSHRLVQRGLSRRSAVIVIWSATAATGIGGIALGTLRPWQAALVGVQTLAVLAMLWLLEHATRERAARAGGP
jgi:UDP-GlcNAc:undecaprenyl-phosphate GlcNAc-1-phosphate transferase